MYVAARSATGLIPARAGKTCRSTSPLRGASAHPRACGENGLAVSGSSGASGSSPRVRGKRDHGLLRARPPGLIPARAGKTVTCCSNLSRSAAHPRACGENTMATPSVAMATGSSPRVRGKRRGDGREQHRVRIIPARAGKTAGRTRSPATSSDHPRACGENGVGSILARSRAGSSPRVRGKPPARTVAARAPGIIPARAGKTCAWRLSMGGTRDHPRACGENLGAEDH